jgi:hypothetical protein
MRLPNELYRMSHTVPSSVTGGLKTTSKYKIWSSPKELARSFMTYHDIVSVEARNRQAFDCECSLFINR